MVTYIYDEPDVSGIPTLVVFYGDGVRLTAMWFDRWTGKINPKADVYLEKQLAQSLRLEYLQDVLIASRIARDECIDNGWITEEQPV